MTAAALQIPGLSEVAKTGALLAMMIVHNLLYPLTGAEGAGPALYYALSAFMFVFGVWVLTAERGWKIAALVVGLAVFVAGIICPLALSPTASLAVYLTSLAHHAIILVVQARYTFARREVLTEVILAATSLYLIIGSMFAAIYGMVLWLDPGGIQAANGAEVQWQQLLYDNHTTLTTVGYGDILPISFHAQSFAAFEAMTGTLYTGRWPRSPTSAWAC